MTATNVDPPESAPAIPPEGLSFGTTFAFAAQAFFGAAMALTVGVFLPKFYIDDVLLPAGVMAVVIAIGRGTDAITDPLMGYISDHTRTRWGRRKPWILAGVLGNTGIYYLLLSPPEAMSETLMAWFGLTFIVSFLFVTMNNVPRAALSVELTLEGTERLFLFGVIALMVQLGLIMGAVMPTVMTAFGYVDPREKMRAIATFYVAGYLLLNLIFLWKVPERESFAGRGEAPFVPGVRRALRNKPFVIMFSSHIVTAIVFAIPGTLLPFFVRYHIRPEDPDAITGYLLLTYLVSSLVALPLWILLASRLGKRIVWLIVSFVGVSGGCFQLMIGEGDVALAFAIMMYVGTQAGAWLFLGGAMHADVVDYDELHSGKRREAQYSAFWAVIPKFALIPGASLPLAILVGVGYQPNEEQSAEVITTLRILYAAVPALFNAIGLSIMWWYPLSEAKQKAIRDGISEHESGRTVTDPITGKLLPPPSKRAVPESVSWRLDYFSKRELTGSLDRDNRALVTAVVAKCAAFLVVFIAAVALATAHGPGAAEDSGIMASLAVVGAGLGLSGLLFQLLKLKPALRLVEDPVSAADVRAHLEEIG